MVLIGILRPQSSPKISLNPLLFLKGTPPWGCTVLSPQKLTVQEKEKVWQGNHNPVDWSHTSSGRQLPRMTSLIMLKDASRVPCHSSCRRESPVDIARPNHELGYSVAEKSQFWCSSTMEANTLAKVQYPWEKLEIINQSPVSAFNQHNIKSKKSSPCVHQHKIKIF